ncbi:MAG: T9SS type A sorting domain-containing protein [Flavobacteriia bacterium]
MKYFVFILTLIAFSSFSQTWQSLPYTQFSNTVPYGQFIINQYSNDIWMVNDNKVAVIENDGTIRLFNYNQLGTLWNGDHLRFTFTPDSIFYMKKTMGLFNFNNYVSSLTVSESNISDITSNKDTVFISRMGTLLKYVDGSVTDTYSSPVEPVVKNGFLYTGSDALGHIVSYLTEYFFTDPEYLLANLNDKKFKRFSDSIYVGTDKGIMFAYNYDILDTITPNNTVNMPSPNVLEIEFDDKDSLWAVFGDVNDVPFAIAKLEGDTWASVFNGSNCPINFLNFKGLEIDTLGNLWVVDNVALHTLLTLNSPQWLGNEELISDGKIVIYPNPSNGKISIVAKDISKVTILDVTGLVVTTIVNPQNTIDVSSLSKGVYFILIETEQGNSLERFVKE